jgi:hypothetical protein
MKTYTRGELTAKLVGMIEPMPTGHVMPPYESRVFARYSERGLWTSTGGPWRVNIHAIEPLLSLDDAIRCAEAKYGPGCWIKQTVAFPAEPGYYQQMRVSSYEPYEYFDNNHALALALALASAVDGERAEVVD